MNTHPMKTHQDGMAGKLAKTFVHSKLTPVIALFSLFIGLAAVWLTPKEEEPQISVPMIDIAVAAPGFEAEEVERKVTEVIERAVWGIDGVEYIYSSSKANGALITARFKVGEPMDPSLVRIHHKLMSLQHELPKNVSVPQVKSYTIDDVPFLVLTFSSPSLSPYELRTHVAPIARKFSSTPDLSRIELLGGEKRTLRVEVNPQKLNQHGVSLLSVAQALEKNNIALPAGKNWSEDQVYDVEVGGRITQVSDVEQIAIGQRAGRVVRAQDIAKVVDGPEVRTRASVLIQKNDQQVQAPQNAVSIVFAKRKGTNVSTLAQELLDRAQIYTQTLNPEIKMSVVRNYGATAEAKSKELIEHLLIATLSVSILIALAMGLRAAIVVAIAIPVTLALTLAIYYFLGYTLNRITLFALIFSIGILVDDAIVVVENIERHFHENPKGGILKATLGGVIEVGNPTILATFTVIAAILPMAFVRGMMGPYMSPIPVGASLAMILSLFIAFTITPWASLRILQSSKTSAHSNDQEPKISKLDQFYKKIMESLLGKKKSAFKFAGLIGVLFMVAFSLIATKHVKVKMLPFDNKNEFQVLLDFPTTTPLQQTLELAQILATQLSQNKNVSMIQVHTGESAPYSFSGMVKHTYLRNAEYQADLQVVLTDKDQRKESSHEIIESLRPLVQDFSKQHQAVSKVLEIPPGPPVLSTMLAEIYGPTAEVRSQVAKEVYQIFKDEPSVVDLDWTERRERSRRVYLFDYKKGGALGGNAAEFAVLGNLIFSETKLTELNEAIHPENIGVILAVQNTARSSSTPFHLQSIPSFESGTLQAELLSQNFKIMDTPVLYRKNLKPVSYVMSELSGSEEAPVYGMLKIQPKIKYATQTAETPWNTSEPIIKWDGEWFITYEVFRDLGGAFAVVVILIYVLVLGWFRSYAVPLIIMAPIPISLIGILPGHAMLGAYFTATSMIGFIAGAGIIVRNSIILVDFIELQMRSGLELKEAVISAGVLRFRPMLLTASAVVVGSAIMLADPIFQGLAVSLMFGEIAATLLSRFAVPVLYYYFVGKTRLKTLKEETCV